MGTMTRDDPAEEKLAKELKRLGNLPKDSEFPPDGRKTELRAEIAKRVAKDAEAIAKLEAAILKNKGNGDLEKVNEDPEPGELNMQLALTRLVADKGEQELARTDGKKFQVKYNLTNDQMFTLCRLAVQVGFYVNTQDLGEYLEQYAKMSPSLLALTPDAAVRLGVDGDKAIIGSCSCSCP